MNQIKAYAGEPHQSPYEMLREFHRVFDAGIDEEITSSNVKLRSRLLSEEHSEVQSELAFGVYNYTIRPELINKKKLTKELADLMYVTIGTAVTFGLPLEEVFKAVHENNMSKAHPDGTIRRREDGKILKPDNFKELDLSSFFKESLCAPYPLFLITI